MSMDTQDMIDTLLNKVIDAATEKGRSDQRYIDQENKMFSKNDEIAVLKEKLSKYEAVPGLPARHFDFVSRNLSPEVMACKIGEVILQARQGNKIAAIKIIREISGAGLKEAKDGYEVCEKQTLGEVINSKLAPGNAGRW